MLATLFSTAQVKYSVAAAPIARATLFPNVHAGQTFTYFVQYRTKKNVKTESRVVTPTGPQDAATTSVLDPTTLAQMAPGSYLVNAARGGLVDQAALFDALVSGHLAGAGLDVFAEEPVGTDEPLSGLGAVVLTPHIAWESAAARRAVFVRAAQCVAAVLKGDEPTDVVGRPRDSR